MNDWKATAILMKSFERKTPTKAILAVTIQTETMLVVAIESTRPPRGAKEIIDRVEHTFSNHGHKTVGVFPGLAECIAGAENFGKQWQFGRSIERCDCEEIGEFIKPPVPFTEEELLRLRERTTLPAPPPGAPNDEP